MFIPGVTDYIHQGSLPLSWEYYFSGYGPYGPNYVDRNIASGYVTSAVPEPSPYVMLLAGLGLLGFIAYRRKINSSDIPTAV